MRIVQPNPHPATDNLQGSAYVRALGNDFSLGLELLTWIGGRHVLDRVVSDEESNTEESLNRVTDIVSRLRMIASASRSGPEMREIIDRNALEANRFCNDRHGFYLNAMYGQAYIHHVTTALGHRRNKINPADLYNLGVAHFRLDMLHQLIFQDRRAGIRHSQGVHTVLEAELMLQDRLDLPVNHLREQVAVGGVTPAMADNLERRVQQATIADGGAKVWAFMSTWEPWVHYVSELPHVAAQKEHMDHIFRTQTNQLIEMRNDQTSWVHNMSEADYFQRMNQAMKNRSEWLSVVTGENTWTFLMNYRTNIHMDRQNLPARLRNN